jgi:hypothetical protein
MNRETAILQIVPHQPGTDDGVGDYAMAIARQFARNHGMRSAFAVAGPTTVTEKNGFPILAGLDAALNELTSSAIPHVILHYANYGYDKRGVPRRLLEAVRAMRPRVSGSWITTFHELYASGPPWRSAFWTRPAQVSIARELMDLSSACVVSNEVIKQEILRHDGNKRVHVIPVMSNFGEPQWSSLPPKSSRHWAICGGTELIERSLRAFARIHDRIPAEHQPEHVTIAGGAKVGGIERELQALARKLSRVTFEYHPQVSVEKASTLLAPCGFGWLDYFGRGKAWPGMIFKSGSLAACCAHGIIPILSHREDELRLGADTFPGPFFIAPNGAKFPDSSAVTATQKALHTWYENHASSARVAALYAEALS